MRRLAILIALVTAACGGAARGPAWPKSASDDTDGGESLAPRPGSVVISAKEADDDDDTVDVSSDKPTEKPTSTDDGSSDPSSSTITAPEEVINLDDLVIEIDE